MAVQELGLFGASAFGVHVAFVVRERHFGVDDDVPVVGEVQDEVRYQSFPIVSLGSLAGFVPEGFLCVKLLSFFQLEVFQQLLQFQFSEVALYLYLPSECACQPVSRFSELPAFLHIYLDGLVQAGEGFALLCLGFVEGFLHGLEALLQRVNDF